MQVREIWGGAIGWTQVTADGILAAIRFCLHPLRHAMAFRRKSPHVTVQLLYSIMPCARASGLSSPRTHAPLGEELPFLVASAFCQCPAQGLGEPILPEEHPPHVCCQQKREDWTWQADQMVARPLDTHTLCVG